MRYKWILLAISGLLLLSACGMTSDCSFFNNCECQDWHSNCSLH